ncbi:DUF1152 domain-containing protein [Streptomyces erythrochromogenes]|uniref:DUF1152 domain-containing protein n=1 Tax=Streptomyces erythrochromogenes TaxID=285574 RepID=UPI00068AEBF0|nr:DUF1152 domain-containing protein [Streptomyces erythrochromogenes]
MSDLYVAAGGGGDPLGTLIAARTLTAAPEAALIATYAWERPEVDPTHGPLGEEHFTGLVRDAGGAPAFSPATRARRPAGSTLPALARDLPARLLLLDPSRGLQALAGQIGAAAAASGGRIRIVDIGGDILTHGDEPGLCSPFGDALTLAACHLTGLPTTVHVAGPGLDGEIDERSLLGRLAGRHPHIPGPAAVSAAGRALAWHPSEASALWAAAVLGARGSVRTVNHALELTEASPGLYPLPLAEAIGHNPVARALLERPPPPSRRRPTSPTGSPASTGWRPSTPGRPGRTGRRAQSPSSTGTRPSRPSTRPPTAPATSPSGSPPAPSACTGRTSRTCAGSSAATPRCSRCPEPRPGPAAPPCGRARPPDVIRRTYAPGHSVRSIPNSTLS